MDNYKDENIIQNQNIDGQRSILVSEEVSEDEKHTEEDKNLKQNYQKKKLI